MSDEYEDDDDAAVPAAAPSPKPRIIGDGLARTFDRRIPTVIGIVLIIAALCYAYVVQTTRSAMSQTASTAAVLPPPPMSTESLKLPSAPSPTPRPVAIVTPQRRPPIAYVPPPTRIEPAPAPPAADPATPSPEEEFAAQERRRILEARRASSRVTFDQDSQLVAENARDGADLAHGSQLVAQASTGYLPTSTRYSVVRGTIINATWEVNYDSTLPGGMLRAKVSKNVLDSLTHSIVVIPAGAFIIGSNAPQDQPGRARGLTFWDELEMPPPDSRQFDFGTNVGAGRAGENGVDVTVNTQAGRDFSRAVFYSILQAGLNLASRASTIVDFGSGTSQVLQPPSRSIPTFYAKIGDPLTIIVAHDLPLDRFKETQ